MTNQRSLAEIKAEPDPFQRHYTLDELAKVWHVSRRTLDSWFRHEPGVIRWGAGKLTKARKRTHVSLRVPESVARRVYRAHTRKELGGELLGK
jgi:hypothetical protein